jgi:uncharacterized protein (TIGR02246 family)
MQYRTRPSTAFVATLGLGLALLLGLLSGCGGVAHAQANAPADPPDAAVIASYVQALNAGMQTGDFTALLNLYAPDAVLTTSPPTGVTKVSTGTAEIAAFFQAFHTAHPGIIFAVDSVRILSPHVVLTYEHASPPGWAAPGRCMHLYILKQGQVQSLDWTTFYPGRQV